MSTADVLQEKGRELHERFTPELENAKRELDSLNDQVVGFIKRRPVTSLVIALTAGFVIGRIASR
jgi:ElaB/YqjD/DUF883 family membrane-anchored ribosome-binding protein